MNVETAELRGGEAYRAQFLVNLAAQGKLRYSREQYHNVEVHGRALLIEPLNDAPFILEDMTAEAVPGFTPLPIVTRTRFVPEAGSGTDALRARMHAQLYLHLREERPQ